ncbi:hypothetical protein B0J11DRAFT_536358 [Dendryphion nanum]|uniref:CMP/dCMP-type deaminase domain-containing protein n=1 Tax=Dendryphion nanum TaxID=256645 RepID=A0A9P9DET2_9PLEO|nr:hypothetical protein B0J11DRAFT_536358 [Dendryphion nanum]
MVSLRGGDDPAYLVGGEDERQHLVPVPLPDLIPLRGHLKPLRTKDEVRASLETFQAYVIELPSRYAAAIKDVIQKAIPDLKTADFQHLRRVAQFKYLPPLLQKTVRSSRGGDDETSDEVPSEEEDVAEQDDAVRYFLVAPTTAIGHAELVDALRQIPPFVDTGVPPRLYYVKVPKYSPTSAEQAAQWSTDYWPISYKNTNPYGPHPSLVVRNTAEIGPEAGYWLALAEKAASQMAALGFGESVGCVVVNNAGGRREVIAAAADCRWRSPTGESEIPHGPGNVMAHAVERAVAMVAKKRLRAAGKNPNFLDRQLFCDSPLTELEKQYFELDNVPSAGYLCVELDIYLTHEPCVMCSMAILHSRFKRCVFGRRMPQTGGMTADAGHGNLCPDNNLPKGPGHGIFWRPSELNWKLLAWEWEAEMANDELALKPSDTMHA